MRIYISLSENEFHMLKKEADQHSMTIPAYSKAKLFDYASIHGVADLIKRIEQLPSGKTFFISDLYDPAEWSSYDRSQKLTLARQLAKAKNSLGVSVYKFRKGYPTEYLKN